MSYTQALKNNNEMLENMKKTLETLTTTLSNFNSVKKKSIDLTKLEKKELRETVSAQEGLNKRNKILNAALELNNNQLKFGAKSWKDYKKAGGTTLEYLATFMTSTKEEVRLFGIEAASARRFMYGFLPPGMFRLVNKLSTAFNGIGSAIRAVGDGTKDSNNAFTTMLKIGSKVKKLGDFTGGEIYSSAKGAFKSGRKLLKKDKRMRGGIKAQKGEINELVLK